MIEAAKLELEALTKEKWFRIGLGEANDPKVEAAIAALDAAITAAEKQAPTVCLPRPVWQAVLRVNEFAETHVCTTPPAAQRPWVGLTDEEVDLFVENRRAEDCVFVRSVEAKLKEKNT